MKQDSFLDDLPALDPIIAHEVTDYGWRGLTGKGEVFEVRSQDPRHKAEPPESLVEYVNGKRVGRRALPEKPRKGVVGKYLKHFNHALDLYKTNQFGEALAEVNAAAAIEPTVRTRFNRGLIQLSMGRWLEGFENYEARLELVNPPLCRAAEAIGVPRWRGEEIIGKRLAIVQDAGYGDVIMVLRYVPLLALMGIDVVLVVPHELRYLSSQVAPVQDDARGADYYCPSLSLLHALRQTPESVPTKPYLRATGALVHKWKMRLGARRKVGIAWSVGRLVDGDFPRSIPLRQLVTALGNVDLYSLQTQGAEEALDLGVNAFEITDFSDVAALIALMDEVVCIDTAALNLAGAMGHPRTFALLGHWASWRWYNNAFYPGINLCRQTISGDWDSALKQVTICQ